MKRKMSANSTSSATSGAVSSGSGSHAPTYASLRRGRCSCCERCSIWGTTDLTDCGRALVDGFRDLRPPGAGTRRCAPTARGRFSGRDTSCARGVPTGGRNGRHAEPARHPRAGRRRLERRWRSQADHAAAHRGGRQGGSLVCRRLGRGRRRDVGRAGAGQRLLGSDHAAQRRSTASWRCGSRTASSPASTTCAIPRSCRVWSGRLL